MPAFLRNSLLILLALIWAGQSMAQASGKVPWTENRKLTWEDFSQIRDNGYGYAATTYWELAYDMQWAVTEPVFTVHVYQVKEKSWVKKGRESHKLLAHEQVHFDIAEIYARKLRKRLSAWKPGREKPNAIFNEVMVEATDVQDQYDQETDHGTRPEAQARWEEKVKADLHSLRAWVR